MNITEPNKLMNRPVYDIDHEKIGDIKQLYVDEESNQLTWAAVSAGGLFGGKEAMLPLNAVHMENEDLVIDLPKDVIKKAPQVNAEAELTEQDQETLLNFYQATFTKQQELADMPMDNAPSEVSDSGNTMLPHSDENMQVGKEEHAQTHLRFKKYIVTEVQTVTAPLNKEKLRVETNEPITDVNRDAATGGDMTKQRDSILHEEVPKIHKEPE